MAKKLFYETAEFKALHAKWTQKLKDAEFDDIENGEDSTVVRPQVIKTEKSQYDGGTSYYELCQSILRDYRFNSTVERELFELHTSGKSIRDIEETLSTTSSRQRSKSTIDRIIRRVKEDYLKGAK